MGRAGLVAIPVVVAAAVAVTGIALVANACPGERDDTCWPSDAVAAVANRTARRIKLEQRLVAVAVAVAVVAATVVTKYCKLNDVFT